MALQGNFKILAWQFLKRVTLMVGKKNMIEQIWKSFTIFL
jgi:hypothetical protein